MEDKSGLSILRDDTPTRKARLPARRYVFFAGLAASIAGEAALIWHAITHTEPLGMGLIASVMLLAAGNCAILAENRQKIASAERFQE